MSTYALSPRQIPLDERFDVIVVGGGPAGCAAAASAAREGARTLLIEATGALGGMGTSGLIPAWCPFSDHERIIYSGIAERVFTNCKSGMKHIDPKATDWVPIDAELLKRIYDDLVTGAGAEVLFNTVVTGLETKAPGEADVVLTAGKDGLRAYRAPVFIDCSGDADLACWAGAEYELGDPVDHDLQPATHCFILTNVDDYHYRYGQNLHPNNAKSPIYQIVGSGEFPLIPDWHCCNSPVGPNTVGFNAGHLWQVDNTKPETVSKALIQGRKIAAQLHEALKKYAPAAFAASHLVATGALLGVRETRRILGDYYLTADDLMSFKDFDDEIGRNCYFIDVHHKVSQIGSEEEVHSTSFRFPTGKSHGIPYRCLTPKGLRNILMAGRAISTDRPTQGSTRVMPVCLVMGEAAGIAAAMAVKQGGDIRAIDIRQLQKRLKEEGAYLPNA